jgi:hypothetical protein
MNQELHKLLMEWKHPVITSSDIAAVLPNRLDKRYSLVKRLLAKSTLIQLKKGIYLVGKPYNQSLAEPFAIAPLLYAPSHISFESALSHHGWIPEAVYATTSATSKRKKEFLTPVGRFTYNHVPIGNFYLGVQLMESAESSYFLAEPWRAIADICYQRRMGWPNAASLSEDLRIESEDMKASDLNTLKALSEHYLSKRVRKTLVRFYEDLS